MFIRFVQSCLLLMLSGNHSLACFSQVSADNAFFRHADVVIKARVNGYQTVPLEETSEHAEFRANLSTAQGREVRPSESNEATLDLQVLSVVSNNNVDLPDRFKARWEMSARAMPSTWPLPDVVLLGIYSRGSQVYEVVQQVCGPPSILVGSDANVDAVRNVLRHSDRSE